MQQVNEIDTLIKLLAKIPGLGPRSARRAALYLISNSDQILQPPVSYTHLTLPTKA